MMHEHSKEKLRVSLAELLPVLEEQLAAGKEVCFGPKGTSMLPMLRQGIVSVVLQKPPARLKKYDLPLYRRKDGSFVLHRVVGVNGNEYTTCGDNQSVREYHVRHSQVIGVVTGYYRGEEYISCDSAKYKLYCRRRVRRQYWVGKLRMLKQAVKRFLKKMEKKGEQE